MHYSIPKGRSIKNHQNNLGPTEMAELMRKCGIKPTHQQINQLWHYHTLLREHNPELNLTRIHNFTGMIQKLYVDSILPGQMVSLPSPLLDLGTGPGMPGIPLKIMFPDLEIILAESRHRRIDFLNLALQELNLSKIETMGKLITPKFDRPVKGVITRAVEHINKTLHRIRGCLEQHGQAIFMKGPGCDEEIKEAEAEFKGAYKLMLNQPYTIPHSPHARRLVIFERLDQPLRQQKTEAEKRVQVLEIESLQNSRFKEMRQLLTGRGLKKQTHALVAGQKQIQDFLDTFPARCRSWISTRNQAPPPDRMPKDAIWYQTAPDLFQVLDVTGTNHPLLMVDVPPIPSWTPDKNLPTGCTLFIPFQDPENVGAVIRSAVAFNVDRIVLLAESAHPYHPKTIRASGGAVFHADLYAGPSIHHLPIDLPIITLSKEGPPISTYSFPSDFGLLPGLEGPGLPDVWRKKSVAIPISEKVESLNAASATSICLYLWARQNLK